MSAFYCTRCCELADSHDGAEAIGSDLICADCSDYARTEAEEADDRRRDNPLELDFRRLGQ